MQIAFVFCVLAITFIAFLFILVRVRKRERDIERTKKSLHLESFIFSLGLKELKSYMYVCALFFSL